MAVRTHRLNSRRSLIDKGLEGFETGSFGMKVIDPRAVDPEDVETLQDLVLAAVRDAARAANELSEQTMAPISGGAGLPGL